MPQDASRNKALGNIKLRRTRLSADEQGADSDIGSRSSSDTGYGQLMENKEDIELYRQIHVKYFPEETICPFVRPGPNLTLGIQRTLYHLPS